MKTILIILTLVFLFTATTMYHTKVNEKKSLELCSIKAENVDECLKKAMYIIGKDVSKSNIRYSRIQPLILKCYVKCVDYNNFYSK